MTLRSYKDVEGWNGKRVLVRCDLNVQVIDGIAETSPYGRIRRSCEFIEWLSAHGAKVIVIAHLGRPGGVDESLRMKPVHTALEYVLGRKVHYIGALVGSGAKEMIDNMNAGDVALLENVRFDSREIENDATFAKELGELGDIYINNAFGASHRNHSSTAAIQSELPSYAGALLEQEVSVLSEVRDHPKQPLILLMGGLKIKTKIGVIDEFAPHAEKIFVAGALANTFFAQEGKEVGISAFNKDEFFEVETLHKTCGEKLILPSDVCVGLGDSVKCISVDKVQKDEEMVDIGEEMISAFLEAAESANTIIWNGPLGKCETEAYCKGTERVLDALSKMNEKTIVLGGGDTIPLITESQGHTFTLISTGGGAMLKFLAGESLPGIEPLIAS